MNEWTPIITIIYAKSIEYELLCKQFKNGEKIENKISIDNEKNLVKCVLELDCYVFYQHHKFIISIALVHVLVIFDFELKKSKGNLIMLWVSTIHYSFDREEQMKVE